MSQENIFSDKNLGSFIEFGQVVFAGLDLCFSQEGYSHAKDSQERKSGALVAYATQVVETNDGKQVETDTGFFNAISVIEDQAKIAAKSGTRLINPSPNAAKVLNKSIGVKESAAWVFDYIYKKDPQNAAANRLIGELELSA